MPQQDNLPLYLHPFVGSHDAAANEEAKDMMIAGGFPFVQTQEFDFYDQYMHGARWFDLRVQRTIIGDDITFKHGPVLLLDMPVARSFWRMLDKAVQDREIVLLDFNHFDQDQIEFIKTKFQEYLQVNRTVVQGGVPLAPFAAEIENPSQFTITLDSLKQIGKYILWYANWGSGRANAAWIESNYNSQLACFKEAILDSDRCAELSCLGGNQHQNYVDLFASIMADAGRTEAAKQDGDFRLMKMTAHFQAPTKPGGTVGSLTCLPGAGGQAIEQERWGQVNDNIYHFLNNNPSIMPNIISFDNINSATWYIKDILEARAGQIYSVPGVLAAYTARWPWNRP